MRICCVESCTTSCDDAEITLHKFPIKHSLREQWFAATRVRENHYFQKLIYVCSKHFADEDFEVIKGTKRFLKCGAVPSLFPWSSDKGGSAIKTEPDEIATPAMNPSKLPARSSRVPSILRKSIRASKPIESVTELIDLNISKEDLKISDSSHRPNIMKRLPVKKNIKQSKLVVEAPKIDAELDVNDVKESPESNEVTSNVSSGDPVIDAHALEQSAGHSTTENIIEASTAEKIVEASTVENIIEASTGENIIEASTAENIIEASTAENIIETSMTENIKVALTAENIIETSTAENIIEASTAENIIEASTVENIIEASTAENIIEISTTENIKVASTAENIIETSTAENIIGASTAENIIEASTAENIIEASTAENIIETSTAENIKVASMVENIIGASTAENIIEASTTENVPINAKDVEQVVDTAAVKEVEDTATEEKVADDTTTEEVVDKSVTEPAIAKEVEIDHNPLDTTATECNDETVLTADDTEVEMNPETPPPLQTSNDDIQPPPEIIVVNPNEEKAYSEHDFSLQLEESFESQASKSANDTQISSNASNELVDLKNFNTSIDIPDLDNREVQMLDELNILKFKRELDSPCNTPASISVKMEDPLPHDAIGDRASCQTLMVGSTVEVCDFGDIWHVATIHEVDYEEMEVLLHYDIPTLKQDEWISVYSTRLRTSLPKGEMLTHTLKPEPHLMLEPPKRRSRAKKLTFSPRPLPPPRKTKSIKKSKSRVTVRRFIQGERCMARWSNNQRFEATVRAVLDNGRYEVVFDDGFVKIYNEKTLSKLRQISSSKSYNDLKGSPYRSSSGAFAKYDVDAGSSPPVAEPLPVHKHLFDPKIDYLGSKMERREMKRKLNVKDLFKFAKVGVEEKMSSKRKRVPKKPRASFSADGYGSPSRLPPKKKIKRSKDFQRDEIPSPSLMDMSMDSPIYDGLPVAPKEAVEEAVLLPGEWCCRWLNGQPVGIVSEIEMPATTSELTEDTSNAPPPLAKRSVQVDDYRMPPNWSKHMVRRSVGSSAGKWDVVLISPDGHRFRTKYEMKSFLEDPVKAADLKEYENCLLDFAVHRKRSRQMGWDVTDSSIVGAEGRPAPLPPSESRHPALHSPIMRPVKKKKHLPGLKSKPKERMIYSGYPGTEYKSKSKLFSKSSRPYIKPSILKSTPKPPPTPELAESVQPPVTPLQPLEDGFIYVGSLKVQVIDNLLRCPIEGCFKNFRKDNLLQMHIKHYHREMISQMGATPKVLDLASARNYRDPIEHPVTPKLPKVPKENRPKVKKLPEVKFDILSEFDAMGEDIKDMGEDLPTLRNALEAESAKKRHSLHDVADEAHRKFQSQFSAFHDSSPGSPRSDKVDSPLSKMDRNSSQSQSPIRIQKTEFEDIENVIRAHTVITTSVKAKKHRSDRKRSLGHYSHKDHHSKKKKRHSIGGTVASKSTADDAWSMYPNDQEETRSSFGMPEQQNLPAVSLPDRKDNIKSEETVQPNVYINEDGEKIKIVHMKREEIINCACGFNEEDGLMIQCELCLCWQHALCHSIETESQVPDKYVCYICLNPRRGRRSQRYLWDQTWLYEGTLPSWKGVTPAADPAETTARVAALKKSFELSGNLYLISQALHAIKVKMHVAKKKDHPKLYLWSKPWDPPANKIPNVVVEQIPDLGSMPKLDLNDMMGKENCPISKPMMKIDPPDINHMKNPMSSDDGGDIHIPVTTDELSKVTDAQLVSQSAATNLLANFLASPGGSSIELPISTSELETLAKSVQDSETQAVCEPAPAYSSAPEPEAAIDLVKCRELLHEHVNKALAAFDVRLDSIEAQIAELESQDPSLADDETAEYCPRTKQTIQMLLRDLQTMEDLARIS